MKKKILSVFGLLIAVSVILCSFPLYAEENVQDMKKKIEELQKQVDELELKQDQQKKDDSWGLFNRGQAGGWDPFSEMSRIQEEMGRMFQSSYDRRGNLGKGMFSNTMSFDYDLDMKETKNGYEIRFDMKGLDKDKIDIQINEHSITVKGEHSRQNTEESANQYFSSQSYGSFMKTIPLPIDADTSKMKTEKEGDILVIRLPKKKT